MAVHWNQRGGEVSDERKYVRTLRELSDRYDWRRVCEVMGLSYWCMNEGADSSDLVWFTEEQARRCGIIKEVAE